MKGRGNDPPVSLPGTSYPSCRSRYCGLRSKQKNTTGKGRLQQKGRRRTEKSKQNKHNHRGSTRFTTASYFLVPSSAREGRLNPPHVLGAGMKQVLGGSTKPAITEHFTLRVTHSSRPSSPIQSASLSGRTHSSHPSSPRPLAPLTSARVTMSLTMVSVGEL